MPISILIDPTATGLQLAQQSRRSLYALTGKTVGFIDNSKPNFNHLVDDLAELLVSKYGVSKIIKRRKRVQAVPASEEVVKELAEQCDLVITGSGD